MRFSTGLPNYILFLLLVSITSFNLVAASDGSDAMKKLCSSLSRATSCKASFKIPTFKVRTGKTDWFQFNPCKTTFRFPFGGKQCLPGTDKVVITVPIGIDVGSKSVDGCSLARQAIPGLEQLAQKSGAICSCLPEVRLVVPTKVLIYEYVSVLVCRCFPSWTATLSSRSCSPEMPERPRRRSSKNSEVSPNAPWMPE